MFFNWDDPQSLSTVLDRIAENPEILVRYRERSAVLRDQFSWAGERKKYVAMLHQLTGVAGSGWCFMRMDALETRVRMAAKPATLKRRRA